MGLAAGDDVRQCGRHGYFVEGVPHQRDVGVRRRGVLIMAGFAIILAMGGSTGVADHTTCRALFAAAVALAVLAAAPAARSGRLPASSRRRRLAEDWQRQFNWVGAAEAVGIGIAVAVCLSVGA